MKASLRMVSSKTLYSSLHLPPSASQSQIKAQYYLLSKKYHPDTNKASHDAHEKFLEINNAYQTLFNKEKRALYDKSLQIKNTKTGPSMSHRHARKVYPSDWILYKNKNGPDVG